MNNTTVGVLNDTVLLQLLTLKADTLAKALYDSKQNLNDFWLLTHGLFIYFMQAGFAFIECGAVNSKNATSVLIRNFIDSFAAGVGYWFFGYAFAYGTMPNRMAGNQNYAGDGMDPAKYSFWFHQYTYAAICTTIVSGAVAERCRLVAYVVYSFVMAGFIYPVITHWAWDPAGWLRRGDGTVAFDDFAGSGVVHVTGGTAALVAAMIVKPRLGRFKNYHGIKRLPIITGHSVPLFTLGGFILSLGFLSFTASATRSLSGPTDGIIASNAMRNTVICACFASITAFFANKIVGMIRHPPGKWSLRLTVNGTLAGMVAVCASCDKIYDWGACIIGVIASVVFIFHSWLLRKIQIDDVTDAAPVHLGAGLCGLLLQPFLKRDTGILFNSNQREAWTALGWQVAGAISIMVWSGGLNAILFGLLNAMKMLRVSEEHEMEGLDTVEQGEPAYVFDLAGDKKKKKHMSRIESTTSLPSALSTSSPGVVSTITAALDLEHPRAYLRTAAVKPEKPMESLV